MAVRWPVRRRGDPPHPFRVSNLRICRSGPLDLRLLLNPPCIDIAYVRVVVHLSGFTCAARVLELAVIPIAAEDDLAGTAPFSGRAFTPWHQCTRFRWVCPGSGGRSMERRPSTGWDHYCPPSVSPSAPSVDPSPEVVGGKGGPPLDSVVAHVLLLRRQSRAAHGGCATRTTVWWSCRGLRISTSRAVPH
jgi:hypothetical protein